MEKIKKKKQAKTKISPSWLMLEMRVITRIRTSASFAMDLRGRASLIVLTAEMFASLGWRENREAITTKKSSQFQASRRYVFLSRINPKAMILIRNSKRKATVKKYSDFSTCILEIREYLRSDS